MKKLMLILVLLLISQIASAQTQAELLYDLLTDPNCAKACYMGIEPGITTAAEVETILTANGILLNIIPLIGEDYYYAWYSNVTETFIDQNYAIHLSISGEVTRQLSIPLTVSVETILEAFGNPDEVKQRTNPNNSTYGLIYSRHNLIFTVSSISGLEQIISAAIAPADAPYMNRVNSFSGSAVNEPCSSYGVAPCIAPTATPFASPTLSPIDFAQTQAEELRDLLINPACQRACILGIQPGASTFQQVVDILDQEEIAYEIFPLGIDATHENSAIDFTYTLAPTLDPNLRIGVSIRDSAVQQILLGLKIPVSTVIEAFGSPDVILRSPLESDPLHNQELPMLYLEEGIAFRVHSGAGFVPDTVYSVFLADPESVLGNYINGFPGEPVNQPCSSYGVAPCIAPTATPTIETLVPVFRIDAGGTTNYTNADGNVWLAD